MRYCLKVWIVCTESILVILKTNKIIISSFSAICLILFAFYAQNTHKCEINPDNPQLLKPINDV